MTGRVAVLLVGEAERRGHVLDELFDPVVDAGLRIVALEDDEHRDRDREQRHEREERGVGEGGGADLAAVPPEERPDERPEVDERTMPRGPCRIREQRHVVAGGGDDLILDPLET